MMIDHLRPFHVLPGKTADFERLHQQLLARISAQLTDALQVSL
jgi:hypothetical protein